MSYFDSADDELRDEEYPDEPDDDDDDIDVVDCPACGAEVYADSEHCPICGEYLTSSTSPLAGRSAAFIVLGIAGILATLWALINVW